MEMATSRGALVGLLALAGAAGGCGGSAAGPPSGASSAGTRPPAPSPNAAVGAFSWLRPAPAPAGWTSVRVRSGGSFAYPPGWHTLPGDAGTASAALLDARGRYLGYLNLTPRQGAERPAGWPAFRLRHNRAEGDRQVHLQAAASGLRFRTGSGTCVRDLYTTSANTRYVEIACLVVGSQATSVIVGAAASGHWMQERGAIEQAISASSA
jgi:hypothetical protein